MNQWLKTQRQILSLLDRKQKLTKARRKTQEKLNDMDRELECLNKEICLIKGHTLIKESDSIKCEVCGKVINNISYQKTLKINDIY